MGMDVYGKEPISKVGEYFRRNAWGWRPLATLCCTLCPKETESCRYWQSNDGDGLDAIGARALADALQDKVNQGALARGWAEAYRDPAQKAGRFDSDPDAEFFSRDMDYIAAEIERPLYGGLTTKHKVVPVRVTVSVGRNRISMFDRATKDAAALAARLGDGWTPCVWENLGWHWEVQKGALVTADRFDAGGMIVRGSLGKYTAEFRSVENGASAIMQFFADASTPEEAIGQVRQDVRTYISRVEADLADSI